MTDWGSQSTHVLTELKRFDRNIEKVADDIKELSQNTTSQLLQIHKDIVALKTKSSTWGAIMGSVFGALISLLLAMFSHK